MSFPLTTDQRWFSIAQETARLSYPGSMSRGEKQVVIAKTKKIVEDYFTKFPIQQVLCLKTSTEYNKWHYSIVKSLAVIIQQQVSSHNQPYSVAAKFLNTYMFQLCKYPEAQHLLPFLHLPLDTRVFNSLKKIKLHSIQKYKKLLNSSPYTLNYRRHLRLQKQLDRLVLELNQRENKEFSVRFRIELNWLWL